MVDTGPESSVLLTPQGPLSGKQTWVQGATGTKPYKWTTRRTVDLGVGWVTHSFLVIPECPYPLLGRDLLTKMRAQIHFMDAGTRIEQPDGKAIGVFLTMPLEEKYRLHRQKSSPSPSMDIWLREFPTVWAKTRGSGGWGGNGAGQTSASNMCGT